MKLTVNMREALTAANSPHGIRRRHTPGPGAPAWPRNPSTLAALLRHELVDHTVILDGAGLWVEVWTTTDAGRLVLHPPPKLVREKSSLMHGKTTVTTIMVAGYWTTIRMPEPEGVPDPHWARDARERHQRDRDKRQDARRLADLARAA